jgi:hypothetical protein
MAVTYKPIATTTLGTAAASISFSSIPGTYTDLRLVIVATMSSGGTMPTLQFNSNTGSNYSTTSLYGTSSAAGSYRTSNYTYFELGGESTGGSTTIPMMLIIDVFSYTGSTNKTILATETNDLNGSGEVTSRVGLWRNTSAITSIQIPTSSGNLNAGTTATLYGIKAA